MDTVAAAQCPQNIVIMETLDGMIAPWPKQPSSTQERKTRHQKLAQALINCPRCNSTNTKFCYYNNYSLSQPRYFCKTCRRYWTEGGSLRNIPVGGSSRKNKRPPVPPLPSSNCSYYSRKQPDLVAPNLSTPQSQNPSLETPQDFLISRLHRLSAAPDGDLKSSFLPFQGYFAAGATTDHLSTAVSTLGFNSIPLPHQLMRPSPSFSSGHEWLGGSYSASFQGVQQANGKPFFLFEDLKLQVTSEQNRDL